MRMLKIKMKNLFIIGTPLQLINAIEAVKYFKLDNNILVLVYRSRESNKKQMQKIIDLYEWEEIIEIPYSSSSSMLKYIKLVKYLKTYIYNYIFIAKLEVIPKLVLPNTQKQKVFFLDDGTFTIAIYEKQIKKNILNKYNFKELRFLLFGLKVKIRDTINLFTYFDLKPSNGNEIIKNSLNYLRDTYLQESMLKDFSRDDEVIYFLGQPLESLIDIQVYKNSVESIIKKFNKKIIYICHRGESKEAQNILSTIDKSSFELLDIGMPVELYFLYNKIYPAHIVSYCSTAVTTVGMLYEGCKSNYIQMRVDEKNEKNYNVDHKYYYEIFDKKRILTFDELGI